jgi:hypothetical protein
MVIHRLSNFFKDAQAKHLEFVREAIARSREVLGVPRPDTFAGRKTQEPFPDGDEA